METNHKPILGYGTLHILIYLIKWLF